MLAILDNKPKIFNIKEILTAYAAHRREVIVRRTQFDLDKDGKKSSYFRRFENRFRKYRRCD